MGAKSFMRKRVMALAASLMMGVSVLSGCVTQPATVLPTEEPVITVPAEEYPQINPQALDRQTADGMIRLLQRGQVLFYEQQETERLLEASAANDAAAALLKVAGQTVSIRELGAKGDGTADDSAAFEAMGQKTCGIYLPKGVYQVTRDVEVPANVALIFEGGATIRVEEGACLTLNGFVYAPMEQIFSGKIAGDPQTKVGYPQWFGITYKAEADTLAVQACVDLFDTTVLTDYNRAYKLNTLHIPEGKTLRGESGNQTVIELPRGNEALFSVEGSNVHIEKFEVVLSDGDKANTAVLLNNSLQALDNISVHTVTVKYGQHIIRDTDGGQAVTNLRLFEILGWDQRATPFLFRDVRAMLTMRHCVADTNGLGKRINIDYPGVYVADCAGILIEQGDVLGSRNQGMKGHAFVLERCAGLYLDRLYCDTLNGDGIVLTDCVYGTLYNCGSGLNNGAGLRMTRCEDFDIELFKQFGRYELDRVEEVPGILLTSCRNIRFDNVQSLCNYGDAFVLADSTEIRIQSYMSYMNTGRFFVETGSSDYNAVDGLVATSSVSPLPLLVGEHSGIRGFIYNDGQYNPAETGKAQEQAGNYTASVSPDAVFQNEKIGAEAAGQAFERCIARIEAGRLALARANAQPNSGKSARWEDTLKQTYKLFAANVKEKGAKGDGATDDSAAVNAVAKEFGAVYFPAGTYVFHKNVTLPKTTVVILEEGAVLCPGKGVRVYLNAQALLPSAQVFGGEGEIGGIPQSVAGDPAWFGARGDGVTDDSAAFARALQLFAIVRVPAKEKGYVLTALSLPEGRHLCGTGEKAALLIASDKTENLFTLKDNFVALTDVDIDMTRASKKAVGMYFDNSRKGIRNTRVRNLTVTGAGTFVKDANMKNATLIYNNHFDNVQCLSPRGSSFVFTDFFGFVFLRNVVVDYQGNEATKVAFSATTNYGAVYEDCTVQNAGSGNGDGFLFRDLWAVWTKNLTVKNMGGRGIVTTQVKHSYFNDVTVENCAGVAASLSGDYFQFCNLKAVNTKGVLLTGLNYFNSSHITVENSTASGVTLASSKCCLLTDVQVSGATEESLAEILNGDFNAVVRTNVTNGSMTGKNSLLIAGE